MTPSIGDECGRGAVLPSPEKRAEIVHDLRAGYGIDDIWVRTPGLTRTEIENVVTVLRRIGALDPKSSPGFFAPTTHPRAPA